MRSKKGAGHVEVIISFVIFIGFLVFLFFIFNPLELVRDTSLVDSVFIKMEERIAIEVFSVSLSLNSPGDVQGCFGIPDDLNCAEEGKEVRVLDKDGVSDIEAELASERIYVEKDSDNFYTVVCTEDIDASAPPGGCTDDDDLNEDQFDLGIISEKRVWSDEGFQRFMGEYEEYESLKDDFVPRGSDFGFRVWDLDDQETPLYRGGESPQTRVDARTMPIDVISNEGIITKRTLTILTW